MCVNFIPPGSCVYIDNYFNSLDLLLSMLNYNISVIGTIRQDRTQTAPLKDIGKTSRGTIHALRSTDKNITLVRWRDNSQVTMASNVQDSNLTLTYGQCQRLSGKEKKRVSVQQPTLVYMYNKGMGGVDLFDQHRGLYRIRIRSRKWYCPIFRFCLNGAIVNMWLLYKKTAPGVPLQEFVRRITLAVLTSTQVPSPRGGKPRKKSLILPEIRFDGIGHLVDKQGTQRRCGSCGKCTMYCCVKCNIGLHPESCFVKFHKC